MKVVFEGKTMKKIAEQMIQALVEMRVINVTGKEGANETGENDRGGDAEVR